MKDSINPQHYTSHPSGIECIELTKYMTFPIGNALKYVWRHDRKNGVEDLKKAVWYLRCALELAIDPSYEALPVARASLLKTKQNIHKIRESETRRWFIRFLDALCRADYSTCIDILNDEIKNYANRN